MLHSFVEMILCIREIELVFVIYDFRPYFSASFTHLKGLASIQFQVYFLLTVFKPEYIPQLAL